MIDFQTRKAAAEAEYEAALKELAAARVRHRRAKRELSQVVNVAAAVAKIPAEALEGVTLSVVDGRVVQELP